MKKTEEKLNKIIKKLDHIDNLFSMMICMYADKNNMDLKFIKKLYRAGENNPPEDRSPE